MYGKMKDRENLQSVLADIQKDIEKSKSAVDARDLSLLNSHQAFVEQMTKINGGRVFYSTPENLGEYLLVDYVQHKRKQLNRQ